MNPICVGCNQRPQDLPEYVSVWELEREDYENVDEWVIVNEGTLNPENGHFLCTDCYINAGMPSSPRGWIAP